MRASACRPAVLVPLLAAALAACGGGGLPAQGAGGPSGPPILQPLATGARWTYRVTDPVKGVFEKHVSVVGPENVPELGTPTPAVATRDVEPTGEERDWYEVKDGFLVRQREEDWRAGTLVRVTTWSPAAPKWLAAVAQAGFTTQITVNEREWHPDGTVSTKSPIYQFKVVATDVAVTVPAGTFSCLQVERQRLDKVDVKHTYWLAPGVGKVKEDSDRLEELSAYEPGA